MAENQLLPQGLPPEYMAEIEALNKRRALAQALQKQSLGFQGAQSTGKVAAKTSPLAWIANTATGLLGNHMDSKGASGIAEVQTRAGGDMRAELAKLLATPEDQQFALGQQGKFSQTQALAKALNDQRIKRIESFATTAKDTDPAGASRALITGKLPGADYAPPAPEQPTFGTAPDGSTVVYDRNRKGEVSTKFAPKNGATINMPGYEGREALGFHKDELTRRRGEADSAKGVLAANTRAIDALEQGAQAGGGQDIKQLYRKTLQAFGIDAPATAQTEELGMALGQAVLNEAAKLKPVSNQDMADLRKIVGGISTDPTALTKAIAFSQALALKTTMGYNDYITEQNANLTNPEARGLFSGAGIGYETPGQLSGPMPLQIEVIRQLQRQGVDISRFKDPLGRAFQPGDKFSTKPTSGMPGITKPAKTPVGWEKLTPAEQQEYLRLKGAQ